MTETIICPLWDQSDKRFRSRHYHAWDRCCDLCGRKVVISEVTKRQIETSIMTTVLCEQCALVQWQQATLEVPTEYECGLVDAEEPTHVDADSCATCEELKIQEEEAALESARCQGLPDRDAAEKAHKRWAHLSRARWGHRFKAHR